MGEARNVDFEAHGWIFAAYIGQSRAYTAPAPDAHGCACTTVPRCVRAATQEDGLCDLCRALHVPGGGAA